MTSAQHIGELGKEANRSPDAVRLIEAISMPYDYWYDRYQAYYTVGLEEAVTERGGHLMRRSLAYFPALQRQLRRIRHSSRLKKMLMGQHELVFKALDQLAAGVAAPGRSPSGLFHPLVGQYVFASSGGADLKVCIDSQDSGEIASNELAEWSDVYFKTNFWTNRTYPPNITPLANCNPLLLPWLPYLRSLRSAEKTYDLCFIVRVWGGDDEISGIEHVLRLLEAVAKTRCSKFVLAYLCAGDISACKKRLESHGVVCTTSPMPLTELWQITACSRLNIIRLGMHACIPWRMADLLAVGACPVLDQDPYTAWPVPLRLGTNYLSLNASTNLKAPLASVEQYQRISAMLEEYLSNDRLLENIQDANARYFDQHLTPHAIGEFLCNGVQAVARP